MPTAFELLKQKSVQQNARGLSAFELLKNKAISQSETPQEKKPGLFQGFVQDVARPFLKTAVTAGKAAEGVAGIVSRDLERVKKAATQEEVDFGYFGKVKPVQTVKEAAGVGLEIASYMPITSGVRAVAGLKTGLKESIKQGAKIGAKEGAFGGALYGAGEAAEEEKDLDEILGRGLLGGGLGAGFGAGVGAAIPLAKVGVKKAISPFLEKTPDKIVRLEQKVADEYSKALNLNATQRKLEQRSERDVALFLAKEGVEVQVEKGQLVADDALEALGRKARAENQAFEGLLRDDGGYINLEAIRRHAKSLIDEVGTARTIAENKIDDELNAFVDQYASQGIKNKVGDVLIPKYISNQLKQKMWQAGKFNRLAIPDEQAKAGASRMIGNAFKTAIEKTTKDANIQKFNQRLGDLAEAQFMLNSRNGMTVKGGRLGKYFGRTIGAIVGAKGGPLGSLVGATAGDKIADFAQNPAITTGMWQRALRRLRKEGQDGLVDQIEGILEKRAVERASRKLLPAGKTLFMGAEKFKQPTSKLFEAAKTSGRDPKTGRFKLFYQSVPKKK